MWWRDVPAQGHVGGHAAGGGRAQVGLAHSALLWNTTQGCSTRVREEVVFPMTRGRPTGESGGKKVSIGPPSAAHNQSQTYYRYESLSYGHGSVRILSVKRTGVRGGQDDPGVELDLDTPA